MKISFGKNEGELVEKLLLDDPGYIQWMLAQPAPSGPMSAVVRHVRRCLDNFDAKLFAKECYGSGCSRTATKVSLYRGSPSTYYWCATCSPYQSGAAPGYLTIVTTFEAALDHVSRTVGTKDALRDVADSLVAAKGLAKPRREQRLVAFFASSK